MINKDITVWFSCGAASAVATYFTLKKYGNNNRIRVVNNPVKEEHEDNLRFLSDIESWLNIKVEFAVNSNFPDCSAKTVWSHHKYMSGIAGAPCTMRLKKHARQEWENKNNSDYLVLGFTADEKKRSDRFKITERNNLLSVLVDEGITKQDCFNILLDNGISLPKIYSMGFPNANCIGCVKATSPTYWNLVRSKFPEVFNERAKQSRLIGSKLVRYKNERIMLDELPKNAKGRSLKNYDFECGIFCEEKL
jgi:3'-phosphoadenosine 5'-phosphosulfate sulfotransferase (PAPS reductase)/FAD synthetase